MIEPSPGPAGEPARDDETPLDVGRLVFFSDAVFAIAITLLVIDLGVPDELATDAALRDALAALFPSLLSFGLTFAVTGLWWTSHHRLLRLIEHPHGLLVGLNFVLLGGIAFLPFATAVIGHHGDLPTAVALYGGTNVMIAFVLVAMREVARRGGLLRADVDLAAFRKRTVYAVLTGLVFLASIPLGYLSPDLGRATWDLVFVVVIVRIISERRARRAASSPPAAAGG